MQTHFIEKTLVTKKLLTLFLTLAALAPALKAPAAFAQRRGGGGAAQRNAPAGPGSGAPEAAGAACAAWRGKITYHSNASESSQAQVPAYGTDYTTTSNTVTGEITLDGARGASGQMSLRSKQKTETIGSKKDCCWVNLAGCQKETVTKWNYTTESSANGVGAGAASAEVRVSGARYKLDFALPQARGTVSTRATKTMSGSCAEEMNKSDTMTLPNEEKFFEVVRARAEGTVDPRNPNVLEGSFQPDKDTMVRWSLTKVSGNPAECEGDLMLSGLKLEENVFPDKSAWQEVGANTVDGNRVRLTATVSNGASKAKGGTVTFREVSSGEVLGAKGVNVPAGGESRVEVMWDTSGFAWTDLGEKVASRRVEARLDNGDTAESEVKVYPKPVVLVHGLWSSAEAWSAYPGYLREAHSFAWRGYAVGADPKHGRMNTGGSFLSSEPTNSIFQNAQELGRQIKAAQTEMNAWHVDLVAHSMGGLISRFYIHSFMPEDSPDGRPYVNRLVMLGTPNQGSPCADLMDSYFDFLEKPVEAIRQLKPEVVADFNRQTTNRKGVRFSILSGYLAPRTCQSSEIGDGVVSLSSALWQVADRGFAPRVHTALTGKDDFDAFVKPRLALGPKKAKQTAGLDDQGAPAPFAESGAGRVELASHAAPAAGLFARAAASKPRVVAAKAVRVAPEGKLDVPVSFPAGSRAGVSFIAPPKVTVTLVRETEEENLRFEAEQSDGLFRTIYVDGASAGGWTLRFESESPVEEAALFSAWADANPASLVILQAQTEDGTRVYVQARLAENGSPVAGAVVTASLRAADGTASALRLYDDGRHDDGEEGDGVYGGRSADNLARADYLVEVTSNAASATGFVSFGR
jgi:pimeloyl-ACP methyl ester carboxylesterase